MSKKDEALKLALEALMEATKIHASSCKCSVCRAVIITREALAEQPAYRAVKTFHEGKPVYVAEQPAQGCEFCSHPLYAGTKCKNCGRERPAQQQEAVAWVVEDQNGERLEWADDAHIGWGWKKLPLYTSPPASKPLTDEQIKRMAAPWFLSMYWPLCNTFARAIEAAHGIKGDA